MRTEARLWPPTRFLEIFTEILVDIVVREPRSPSFTRGDRARIYVSIRSILEQSGNYSVQIPSLNLYVGLRQITPGRKRWDAY